MQIVYDEYGIDWSSPLPQEVDDTVTEVEVPAMAYSIQPIELMQLETTIDPLRQSDSQGVDVYVEALHYIQDMINRTEL